VEMEASHKYGMITSVDASTASLFICDDVVFSLSSLYLRLKARPWNCIYPLARHVCRPANAHSLMQQYCLLQLAGDVVAKQRRQINCVGSVLIHG